MSKAQVPMYKPYKHTHHAFHSEAPVDVDLLGPPTLQKLCLRFICENIHDFRKMPMSGLPSNLLESIVQTASSAQKLTLPLFSVGLKGGSVQNVDLAECGRVTDQWLSELRFYPISNLNLSGCSKLSDTGLKFLHRLVLPPLLTDQQRQSTTPEDPRKKVSFSSQPKRQQVSTARGSAHKSRLEKTAGGGSSGDEETERIKERKQKKANGNKKEQQQKTPSPHKGRESPKTGSPGRQHNFNGGGGSGGRQSPSGSKKQQQRGSPSPQPQPNHNTQHRHSPSPSQKDGGGGQSISGGGSKGVSSPAMRITSASALPTFVGFYGSEYNVSGDCSNQSPSSHGGDHFPQSSSPLLDPSLSSPSPSTPPCGGRNGLLGFPIFQRQDDHQTTFDPSLPPQHLPLPLPPPVPGPAQICQTLETLDLSGCVNLTGDGMQFLEHLSGLKSLSLEGCENVTNTGVITLSRFLTNLTSLSLKRCPKITSSGIASLSSLSSLRSFNLAFNNMLTTDSLSILRELPRLNHLNLYGLNRLHSNAAEHISACLNLEHLDLGGCPKISEISGISRLGNCLKQLILAESSVGDECVETLLGLSNLQSLDISRCRSMSPSGIMELGRLHSLESLNVKSTALDDDCLLNFTSLSNLRYLNVSDCVDITDSGLAALSSLTSLVALKARFCNMISHDAFGHLTSLKNLNYLNISSCPNVGLGPEMVADPPLLQGLGLTSPLLEDSSSATSTNLPQSQSPFSSPPIHPSSSSTTSQPHFLPHFTLLSNDNRNQEEERNREFPLGDRKSVTIKLPQQHDSEDDSFWSYHTEDEGTETETDQEDLWTQIEREKQKSKNSIVFQHTESTGDLLWLGNQSHAQTPNFEHPELTPSISPLVFSPVIVDPGDEGESGILPSTRQSNNGHQQSTFEQNRGGGGGSSSSEVERQPLPLPQRASRERERDGRARRNEHNLHNHHGGVNAGALIAAAVGGGGSGSNLSLREARRSLSPPRGFGHPESSHQLRQEMNEFLEMQRDLIRDRYIDTVLGLNFDFHPAAFLGVLSPTLTSLSLSNCPMLSQDDLMALCLLSKLQHLDLSGCCVTDDVLFSLCACNPDLRSLDLSNTQISDVALPYLACLSRLESVSLAQCPRVTPQGFAVLSDLEHLSVLNLSGCKITDDCLLLLGPKLKPTLTSLNLSQCSKIGDQGVKGVVCMSELRYLNLTGCRVTDAGLNLLKGLTNLQALRISLWNMVSDRGLSCIPQIENLNSFKASQLKFSM